MQLPKIEFKDYTVCSGGHRMQRPYTRVLEITWRERIYILKFGIRPSDPWKNPMCGKCLGIR